MKFIFEKFNKRIKIFYNDLKLDLKQKRIAEDNADHILMLSPSDARVKFKYRTVGDGFYGHCSVVSSVGRFSVKSRGPSFEECAQRLKENMMGRLNSWKQLRFLESASAEQYFDRVG